MTVTVTDVVGLFDKNFKQLVPEGRPLKATVTQPSKVMEHPLETGATVADHRVFQPVEIELTLVIPFVNFQRLRAIHKQAETITVRTNAGTFENMVIETLPHDETTDVFDKIATAVKLREVVFVDTQFQALPPKAAGGKGNRNTSTAKKGSQSGKPASATTQRKASVLYGLLGLGGGG